MDRTPDGARSEGRPLHGRGGDTGRVEAAAERRRAAAELDLPMARGKVLFPDAQIEYVTAAGVGEVDQARNAERTER